MTGRVVRRPALAGVAVAAMMTTGLAAAASPVGDGHHQGGSGATATPIKHLVVIFDENISFKTVI